jgi:hypothetical protein
MYKTPHPPGSIACEPSVPEDPNIIEVIEPIGTIMGTTTIAISLETKELLRHLGNKGESYEQIVRRLVKKAAWKELDEKWNRILEEDEFIPLDEL